MVRGGRAKVSAFGRGAARRLRVTKSGRCVPRSSSSRRLQKVPVSYHDFFGYATDNDRERQPASTASEGFQPGESAQHQRFLVEVEEGGVGPLARDALPQGRPGRQPRLGNQPLRQGQFGLGGMSG